MRTAIIAVCFFCIGFAAGSCLEKRCLNVAENKESLVFENSVYVRLADGGSMDDILTAAGRKGKK